MSHRGGDVHYASLVARSTQTNPGNDPDKSNRGCVGYRARLASGSGALSPRARACAVLLGALCVPGARPR
jgi:hypothetical protein